MQCVAYAPLGSGSQMIPNDLAERPAVLQVAKETGKTPSQACGSGGCIAVSHSRNAAPATATSWLELKRIWVMKGLCWGPVAIETSLDLMHSVVADGLGRTCIYAHFSTHRFAPYPC